MSKRKPKIHKDHKVDAVNGIVYGVKGNPLSFQKQNKNGYWRTEVKFPDDIRRHEYLQRIVCYYTNGAAPKGKPEVRHLDGDKDNNRGENLKWGNRADQTADNKRNAIPRKASVRLSEAAKKAIRDSDATNTEIALEYNLHQRTVQRIRNS